MFPTFNLTDPIAELQIRMHCIRIRIKHFPSKILDQNVKWFGGFFIILTFHPSRIPDPGVKKAPDPGSGSLTLWIWILSRSSDCGDVPYVYLRTDNSVRKYYSRKAVLRIRNRILTYVFGPPGSGSVSQRYGSRSGSGPFYHQAKLVRKTLIPIVRWLLYDFFFYFEKVISSFVLASYLVNSIFAPNSLCVNW
jgi:hypothetical protein